MRQRSRARALVASVAFLFGLTVLAAAPARASLFSLEASGTISSNTSIDSSISIGTPWSFELVYDTASPDLSPDPTFGSFSNSGSTPALTFFHYQAGSYEATLEHPADFGVNSAIVVTFTAIHALDININASALFPPLAGGPVSFHADFNDFSSRPIFVSDALPTNTALSLASFDENSVSLLPPAGVVTSSSLTSLTLSAVPEPSTAALAIAGLFVMLVVSRRA